MVERPALFRILRYAEGLTQTQLAGLARIAPLRVAAAERLNVRLEVEELERLGRALGLDDGEVGRDLQAETPGASEILAALRVVRLRMVR